MIHQLHRDGVSVKEIARRLNMDRKTVRKYLNNGLEPPNYSLRPARGSCLDRYKAYLEERVRDQPGLSARRLQREIEPLGYTGSYTTLTDFLRDVRPVGFDGYEHRFETPAGQQGQVDFARFTVRFTSEPGVERVVWLFTLVLGHSRYLFGRFAWRQTLDTVVRCHIEAFNEFGGAPRELLYDRMKTAVLGEPEPGEIVYHPTLLSLAAHYGCLVRACKPYRAKTKGKVERPYRYIRQDFFLDGRFEDLDDLNRQFDIWRTDIAHTRVHGTTGRVVSEHFKEERFSLLPLPAGAFNDVLCMERRVTRDGMVSVDGNLYSIPDGKRLKQVQVERTATELRILDGTQVIAIHPLLLGRGQRQLIKGHRRRDKQHAVPAAHKPACVEMDGGEISRRDLSVYEHTGKRLASGEIA
jgi:transposase